MAKFRFRCRVSAQVMNIKPVSIPPLFRALICVQYTTGRDISSIKFSSQVALQSHRKLGNMVAGKVFFLIFVLLK